MVKVKMKDGGNKARSKRDGCECFQDHNNTEVDRCRPICYAPKVRENLVKSLPLSVALPCLHFFSSLNLVPIEN